MPPRVQVALIGTIWSLLATLFFLGWHAPARGSIFGFLGVSFLVCALFMPSAAAAISQALKTLTVGLVLLLSWILLGSVFYLVMVPAGWVLRRTGALRTRRGPERSDSYWSDRPDEPLAVERYLRPF